MLRMDAWYFLRHAEPIDPRRALLMAAIACEVEVKQTLTEQATGKDVESLIRQVVNRPPVAGLFDAPMKAAAGRSLKDDNETVFASIGLLFERRNGLAHRGEMPDEAQARAGVEAMRDAFRWLDGLPSP
jgi:hypothetical protein